MLVLFLRAICLIIQVIDISMRLIQRMKRLRSKFLETILRRPVLISDKTLPRFRLSHHGDNNLSLQIHDNQLDHTWVYTFENMQDYQDCFRTLIEGPTEYHRAPDFFVGPSSRGSEKSSRTELRG